MTVAFQSGLAPYISGLIAQKRAAGYRYDSGEKLLKRFDTFCATHFPDDTTVTFDLAAQWAASCTGQSNSYHNSRISIVRNLSVYILSLGHEAYVPQNLTVKAYRPVLYIPTKEEVRSLLAKMEKPTSHNTYQKRLNKECKVLFLLYFCCGMRLSEGRLLMRENLNLASGVLTVLSSKGEKNRLVYLPQDSIPILSAYLNDIKSIFPDSPWMFPGRGGDAPISTSGVEACFNRYWSKLYETNKLTKHPTPHCLRHAFVVERINEWMREGVDINKMLPYLSRYLGHASPDETHYYYHLAEKAFEVIRKKDAVSGRVIPEVDSYEE